MADEVVSNGTPIFDGGAIKTQTISEHLISSFREFLPKLVLAGIILVIGFIIIKIINMIIRRIFDKLFDEKIASKTKLDKSLQQFLQNSISVLLWIILIIIILASMGVNVSAMIASLGIAGFIVGFALQDTLANLAAGIFILFHKPFKLGDWINVNGIVGGVETIGIAACVLNSPDNTRITIPNSAIWGNPIQNYTGNPTRKLFNLKVSISYEDDMDKAIKIIRDILKKEEKVFNDPAPQVEVIEWGDSSINIAVRPVVKKEDYWDVFFSLNKKIKQQFDKENITIPFPQRDVHHYFNDMPPNLKNPTKTATKKKTTKKVTKKEKK